MPRKANFQLETGADSFTEIPDVECVSERSAYLTRVQIPCM